MLQCLPPRLNLGHLADSLHIRQVQILQMRHSGDVGPRLVSKFRARDRFPFGLHRNCHLVLLPFRLETTKSSKESNVACQE